MLKFLTLYFFQRPLWRESEKTGVIQVTRKGLTFQKSFCNFCCLSIWDFLLTFLEIAQR